MKDKISFAEKLAYGLGDAGCNFVWTTVGSFLTLYYTDSVGISAAVVGTIMLITRLLDGVTDLGMGAIIDKTSTRWGKARPWVLWSALPMGIGVILLFNVPSGLGETGKVVYAFATYVFVAAFAYTASNLSYNALLSLVATDQQDRTVMSTIRFICTMVAVLFISYVTMTFVGKIGWSGTSILYGALTVVFLLITFFGTRERSIQNPSEAATEVPLGTSFKMLFSNKYFILVALLFMGTYAGMGASMGIGVYYARDILGNVGIFGTLIMAQMLPVLVGLPLFPVLAKRFGKWKCMMSGLAIQVVGMLVIALMPANSMAVIVGLILRGLGSAPMTAGLFALVADVVDYGEWKEGTRIDGLTYSATSFGMKVGTGIGTAMVGWGLALGHYDASAASQPASAFFAEKALYYGIPLAFLGFSLVVMYFSNIDAIYGKITADLAKRRAESAPKGV